MRAVELGTLGALARASATTTTNAAHHSANERRTFIVPLA
jgi:hypothetical protein